MAEKQLPKPPADLILRRAFERPKARRERHDNWENWKQENWPEEAIGRPHSDDAMAPAGSTRDNAAIAPVRPAAPDQEHGVPPAAQANNAEDNPSERLTPQAFTPGVMAVALDDITYRLLTLHKMRAPVPAALVLATLRTRWDSQLLDRLSTIRLAADLLTTAAPLWSERWPPGATSREVERVVEGAAQTTYGLRRLNTYFEARDSAEMSLKRALRRVAAAPLILLGIDLAGLPVRTWDLSDAIWDYNTRWPDQDVATWAREHSDEVNPGIYQLTDSTRTIRHTT